MDFYIDVRIKPDAEMRENVLLNKVYTKLHKILFDMKANDLGVSFPEVKVTLGRLLRIHGTSDRLKGLQSKNWLGGLAGYCAVSNVAQVPNVTKYRNMSRAQTTMSNSKLRRLIERKSISPEEVRAYKAKMFASGLSYPYLELDSTSRKQTYRRYIQFGELLDNSVEGTFDQFGLSKKATVPWF